MNLIREACRQLRSVEYRPGLDDGIDRLRRRDKWEQFVLKVEDREEVAMNDGPAPLTQEFQAAQQQQAQTQATVTPTSAPTTTATSSATATTPATTEGGEGDVPALGEEKPVTTNGVAAASTLPPTAPEFEPTGVVPLTTTAGDAQ